MPGPPADLSADEARHLALWAQGLSGPADRRGGAPAVLRRLGAVQLDTISVLARSHELVAYARLGAVPRARVEAAYWGAGAGAFEYWVHAASIVPLDAWPLFAARRAHHASRMRGPARVRETLLRTLRDDGPQTARQLGGARRGGPWWDWSPIKRAAEELLAAGEIVCADRRAWHRVYDLPDRVVPPQLMRHRLPPDEAAAALVRRAGAALGVATVADLADYHRQRVGEVRAAVAASGLCPVTVRGWGQPAWADPAALDALGSGLGRMRAPVLLSPFDSLVWDRARTERIFGLAHRLEAYVPAARRVHGYYAMPVLARGRLVARVDPARRGGTLVARTVTLERPSATADVARAMAAAARWVGATGLSVERVVPPDAAPAMRAALRTATQAM